LSQVIHTGLLIAPDCPLVDALFGLIHTLGSFEPVHVADWQVLNSAVLHPCLLDLLLETQLGLVLPHIRQDWVGVLRLNEQVVGILLEVTVKEQLFAVGLLGLAYQFHDLLVRVLKFIQVGSQIAACFIVD
jgi:hypothetical protein